MKYDICVFGGCSLDQMFYANENNEFLSNPSIVIPGGKGSNQAVAASRAGAKVVIISRVGKDAIGDKIVENLQYNGVFTNNIEIVDRIINDSNKIYINGKTKDNTIVRQNGATNTFTADMINRYSSVLLNSKIILAQLKMPKEVAVELINFCNKNKKTLILTPCRPDKLNINEEGNLELIDKISFITANRKECETIFNTSDIEECVSKYPNKLIITLGEDGVMYHNGYEIVKVASLKIKNLIDTTGAGDTLNGNLVAAMLQGYTLDEAIERSMYASTMKIQKKTAQAGMPTKEELDNYINEKTSQKNK